LASSDDFVSGGTVAVFTDGASATFPIRTYVPSAAGQQVRMLLENDGAAGGFILRFDTIGAHYFLLEHNPATSEIVLAMYNYTTGVQEYTSGVLPTVNWSTPSRVSVDFKQNGTGIDWTVNWYNVGAPSGLFYNGTVPSSTLGWLTAFGAYNDSTGDTAVLGHVTVENTISSMFDVIGAVNAYTGETAAARTLRLAAEEGVTYVLVPGPVTSEAVGYQGSGTFLELFDDAVFTDNGISTEDVSTLAVVYRKLSSMYDQTARLTASYTGNLIEALQPTDDDLYTVNDVTVTRRGGSNSRLTQATGNLSTTAIGTYAQNYDVSLATDNRAYDQAGFRLSLGTIDAPRWPVVGFDAIRFGSTDRASIAAMREGDLVVITNMPSYSGAPSTLSLIVNGWTETITETAWQFRANCGPADVVNNILILDSATYGILDTDRLGV
jgi:hypothetical protein